MYELGFKDTFEGVFGVEGGSVEEELMCIRHFEEDSGGVISPCVFKHSGVQEVYFLFSVIHMFGIMELRKA